MWPMGFLLSNWDDFWNSIVVRNSEKINSQGLGWKYLYRKKSCNFWSLNVNVRSLQKKLSIFVDIFDLEKTRNILIISGIIGFSGCMVIVADFGDHDKGWAFYVSLSASCYVIVQVPWFLQSSKNKSYLQFQTILILPTKFLFIIGIFFSRKLIIYL